MGVPQETILVPLLFILYVNYLLGGMQNDTIMSYPDGMVIISSDNTWYSVQEKICAYLNPVAKWLETAPLRSPKFEPLVNNNSINLQFKFQKHSSELNLLDNYLNGLPKELKVMTFSRQFIYLLIYLFNSRDT